METSSSDMAARPSNPTDCTRPDLAQRLTSGEDLGGFELESHARACASCGMRLSLVRQAERWLADQASSNRPSTRSTTPCPSAEELFDFGRGPGAQELSLAVERRMQAHLVECSECRGLVATLAMRPPAPYFGQAPELADAGARAPLAAPIVVEEERREPVRRGPRPMTRWLTYAAAAAVLAGAVYVWDARRDSHGADRTLVAAGEISYPEPLLLRGELARPLQYPRDYVLAADQSAPAQDSLALRGTASGTWHPLVFEIEPVEGAEGYVFQLERAPKSVFGNKRGESDVLWRSTTLATPSTGLPADVVLSPGNYVWRAWAVQDKLDHPLDARNFQVVDDAEARSKLAELAGRTEPERSTSILLWLANNGFGTDARAYARTLPPGPARDRYLETFPGR